MDLKEWRKKRETGESFVTPSGLEVRLRRVSLLDLAEQGEIPAPLVGMVNMLLDTTTYTLGVEEVPEYAGAINFMVKAVVIDPPAADKADEQHIAVTELPMKDRLAIYNWANTREGLRPFPGKSRQPEGA